MINFIKFIHVLFAVSLLGSVAYCFVGIGSKKFKFERLNKNILLLSLFALLTGTALVYPTHFTFHTPWIQATYFLLFIFGVSVFLLFPLNKKISLKNHWVWRPIYLMLIVLLILITYGAVMKSTVFF